MTANNINSMFNKDNKDRAMSVEKLMADARRVADASGVCADKAMKAIGWLDCRSVLWLCGEDKLKENHEKLFKSFDDIAKDRVSIEITTSV